MWELKKQVRDKMVKYGANEVLTYTFVSGRLLEKAGLDAKNSYRIVNSISPELQFVRQSIVPSLLEKAYMNEKLPVEKFAIFEMNKVYRKEDGLDSEKVPVEKLSLGFLVAERKNRETAYYKAKKYVSKLLSDFGIVADYVPMKSNSAISKPFEPKRSADIMVHDKCIGVVGELKNSVRTGFKLAPYVAGAELDLGMLLEMASTKREIDFSARKGEDLTVTTSKTYAELLADVKKEYPDAIITPGTIYQAIGQKTKNITLHLEIKK